MRRVGRWVSRHASKKASNHHGCVSYGADDFQQKRCDYNGRYNNNNTHIQTHKRVTSGRRER